MSILRSLLANIQGLLVVLTVSPLLAVNGKLPGHGTLEVGLVLGVGKIETLESV